jgi:hypothetical protein
MLLIRIDLPVLYEWIIKMGLTHMHVRVDKEHQPSTTNEILIVHLVDANKKVFDMNAQY